MVELSAMAVSRVKSRKDRCPSSQEARALKPTGFPILVCITQPIIQSLHPANLVRPFPTLHPPTFIGDLSNQVSETPRREESVPPVIQRSRVQVFPLGDGRDPEDLLQDVDVVRDGEQVPAVFVREEVEEIVEPTPRDTRETKAARLVCGQEHAVPRVRTARRRGPALARRVREGRLREELLDAVDLAVEKRRRHFVVRRHRLRDESRFGEDRGAEELVAGRDAIGGQGDDLILDGGEENF